MLLFVVIFPRDLTGQLFQAEGQTLHSETALEAASAALEWAVDLEMTTRLAAASVAVASGLAAASEDSAVLAVEKSEVAVEVRGFRVETQNIETIWQRVHSSVATSTVP